MRVILRHISEALVLNDAAAPWEKRHAAWHVSFDSDYGSGQTWWIGKSLSPGEAPSPIAPPCDVFLDVELDCDSTLEWGDTLTITQNAFPAIVANGSEMLLRGILEGNENEFMTVRIGESLMIAKAFGIPAPLGSVVALRITRLLLYPYPL